MGDKSNSDEYMINIRMHCLNLAAASFKNEPKTVQILARAKDFVQYVMDSIPETVDGQK